MDLPGPALVDLQDVDRQRIEELVGDDDPGGRGLVQDGRVDERQPGCGCPLADLGPAVLVELHRRMAEHPGQRVTVVPEPGQDRQRERAGARPVLEEGEGFAGRPSRSHASATWRASAAPKIGCSSGAVRKSPFRVGRDAAPV